MKMPRKSTRGYEWQKLRKRVLERDSKTCVRCGETNADYKNYPITLEVHHMRAEKMYDDGAEAHFERNLVTVCTKCHETVEGVPVVEQLEIFESDELLEILDMLEEGRCTPSYLADELDVSQEYVRDRLGDLKRLGLIEKVHRGLYEISENGGD